MFLARLVAKLVMDVSVPRHKCDKTNVQWHYEQYEPMRWRSLWCLKLINCFKIKNRKTVWKEIMYVLCLFGRRCEVSRYKILLVHTYEDEHFYAVKWTKTSWTSVIPFEMCLTKEVVPLDTPLTKAPGPRVRPSYGSRKKSDTPLPMLRTRLAGLPRISKDPTTQPETVTWYFCYIVVINHILCIINVMLGDLAYTH